MRKLILPLFILTLLLQFWVPFSMIFKHERILRDGELVRLRTQPFDPADPFQGRYVNLRYAQPYIPSDNKNEPAPDWKEKVFVSFEENTEGLSELKSWSREAPEEGTYLKLKYIRQQQRYDRETKKNIYLGLAFDLPYRRFYMEESKAPVAETIVREGNRSTNCWANIRVLDGEGLIEDVMVGGVSIRELAAERLRK